jgi:phosphoribosylformylglycinamidine cyclo-ligase
LSITYAQSGVDIAEGDRLVQYIKRAVKSTYSKSVLGDVGLFGAFYDVRFKGYKSPVLVSSVDGVGTKLLIAQMMDKHDTIGQDLVNHCVNDIVVCGAKPLFFMDYFSTGKLKSNVAAQVIDGFVTACRENKCSLIGGETAEMPGVYDENVYDLSGTIVGVVERAKIITGKGTKSGDVLLGIPSTGLHTNGYSLARKVLQPSFALDDYVDEIEGTIGEVLLSVHRSYQGVVSSIIKKFSVKGLSHITGGGIVGNTMRVIPRGLSLRIDWSAWERPSIFKLIQRVGNVPEEDMRRTFNLGVGLVMIVSKRESDAISAFIRKKGERCIVVGEVARSVR